MTLTPSMDQAPENAETFQRRTHDWMLECFGEALAADRLERNHRFIEEALELVQSAGMPQTEAHMLVDYVYGRPAGETSQEVGGVMVTLAALCSSHDIDMLATGEMELNRINAPEITAKIRQKQMTKPRRV